MPRFAPSLPAAGLAALLCLAGCAGRTAPAAGAAPAAAPNEAAPPPLACQEVEGLAPLLAPGSGLFVGEIHGTAESPAFVAKAACLGLRAGLFVKIALEVPREEQPRVDAFLGSAGGEADRAALLASPFWQSEYQDGRRSQAMLALFDDLRRLRQGGRPLRVVLIDRQQPPASGQERDRWMADALTAAFAPPGGGEPRPLVILLTGNLHSRITLGTPFDAAYEPAGYLLVQQRPDLRVTALDVSYPGGTAWTCNSADAASCQERSLRGRAEAGSGRVLLHPEVKNGYHGLYEVGPITASPPARGAASGS